MITWDTLFCLMVLVKINPLIQPIGKAKYPVNKYQLVIY